MIDALEPLVTELAEQVSGGDHSGVVVELDRGGSPILELAVGLADRATRRPLTTETLLATASGTKVFTATTIVSQIGDGLLSFDTALVDLARGDLPDVDPRVTVEQLLGHTSGVGDYLDEEQLGDIDDYVLDVPVHTLLGPEDYLTLLRRHPQADEPGQRFRYNNSGYVMLALAIERAAGRSYHDEVRRRVFEPAGMGHTDFLRSDDLPADAARGYLGDGRTNVLHLPVVGTGDGGAYTTCGDMIRFWDAFDSGRIVSPALIERMTTLRSQPPDGPGYGLGVWLGQRGATVQVEGMDAGVSMRSGITPGLGLTHCIIANNSHDAWPLAHVLDRHLERLVAEI